VAKFDDSFSIAIHRSSGQIHISDQHGRIFASLVDSLISTLPPLTEGNTIAFGLELFKMLFASANPFTSAPPQRMIVKLDAADPLVELAWESLHDGQNFLSLASMPIIRLRRISAQTAAVPPPLLTSAPNLRMLVTIAADTPAEADFLRELGVRIGVEVVVLTAPSRARIFAKLQDAAAIEKPFSLWHHSGAAQVDARGLTLLLPKADTLTIDQLNRALNLSHGVKVLTLNLTGQKRTAAPFYAINVPLLLTSIRPLEPLAALALFRTFYTDVWSSGAARAVQKARTQMSIVDFGTYDWASVLHIQSTQEDFLIPQSDHGGEPPIMLRDQVFISYSHADQAWLDKLDPYLRALAIHFKIVIWDDRDITAGQRWHDAIVAALRRSKIALVLGSVHYFSSSYIAQNELPAILEAANSAEMTLLWVALSAYSYQITPLANYQAVIDPKQPMDRRDEHGQQDALLAISDAILRIMSSNPTP